MRTTFSGLALILVTSAAAPSATAGPGGSIGNFRATINGLGKGYLTRGPYPTAVTASATTDAYEFGLAGYRLAVTRLPTSAACPAGGVFKRVCRGALDFERASALVSFASGAGFLVEMTSTGTRPEELRVAFERTLLEFTTLEEGR
jgi:hypothetical protein